MGQGWASIRRIRDRLLPSLSNRALCAVGAAARTMANTQKKRRPHHDAGAVLHGREASAFYFLFLAGSTLMLFMTCFTPSTPRATVAA